MPMIEGLSFHEQLTSSDKPLVILLHGYGANKEDLSPLSHAFPEIKDWNWSFPDAPLSLPMGMFQVGKAWFPIPHERLMALERGDQSFDFTAWSPEELPGLIKSFKNVFEHYKKTYKQIFLGGFSQGSMLAMHLTQALAPETLKGLILLSSAPLGLKSFSKSDFYKGPIFQTHGLNDAVLPFSKALEQKELMEAAGAKVSWHPFEGGHEIPLEALQKLQSFLQTHSS